MGEDADDVLTTTRITAGDRAKYSKVIEKLDNYYKVQTNVIYERADSTVATNSKAKQSTSISLSYTD